MALMNRSSADVETVFLMPHESYTYISSRLIKEVASFGTSVAGMVPPSSRSAWPRSIPQ
jgi:pantetheine-phosphate adenylyltransferase